MDKIEELEKRIAELEARVMQLERAMTMLRGGETWRRVTDGDVAAVNEREKKER